MTDREALAASVAEQARTFVSLGPGESCRAFGASIGGTGSAGLLAPDGEYIWDARRVADRLDDELMSQVDPSGGCLVWWALVITADAYVLEADRDAPIPDWLRAYLEGPGDIDCRSPYGWFLQRKAFDHRPAGELPAWWVERLRAGGYWDEASGDIVTMGYQGDQPDADAPGE